MKIERLDVPPPPPTSSRSTNRAGQLSTPTELADAVAGKDFNAEEQSRGYQGYNKKKQSNSDTLPQDTAANGDAETVKHVNVTA